MFSSGVHPASVARDAQLHTTIDSTSPCIEVPARQSFCARHSVRLLTIAPHARPHEYVGMTARFHIQQTMIAASEQQRRPLT